MLLAELKEAVVNGDMDEVEVLCNRVLEEKFNPVEAVQNGLIKGIEELSTDRYFVKQSVDHTAQLLHPLFPTTHQLLFRSPNH